MQNLKLNGLLDLALKSDEIVEVLESFDLDVVYDFDRLNEGTADAYWVAAHEAGFQLRFDERQVLKTVFVYAKPRDGFSEVDPSIVGVPFYPTFHDAQRAFEVAGVKFTFGTPSHPWIKGQLAEYSAHYEFNIGGELTLITLMAAASEA